VAEPPNFALHRAASTHFQTVHLQLTGFPPALSGVLLLILGCVFSIGLFALTKLATQERQAPVFQAQTHSAIAALQFGRSVTGFAFALLMYGPLQQLHYALLRNVTRDSAITQTLSGLMALLTLVMLYAFTVLHIGRLVASAFPEISLHWLKLPLTTWHYVATPFVKLMLALGQPVERLLAQRLPKVDAATLELRKLIDANLSTLEPLSDPTQQQLLKNVLGFRDTTASDMMVPRTDVVWLSTDDDLGEVLDIISESGHTRFPLCEGTADKVIGYIHAKDLATLRRPEGTLPDLRALARPVTFVPETAKAQMLLERFRTKSHMAIVVDEFGGMSGIITLEDLLEELVGDIRDEFDAAESEVETLANGELVVDGSVHIETLEQRYGVTFGNAEEETVGGFVFGRLAREVQVGDVITTDSHTLEVLAVDGLRVTRVKLSRRASEAAADHPDAAANPTILESLNAAPHFNS
jgi:CBS domain containing-hemolysin-like protein